MRCMRKINGNEVEKFSVIKLISSEEFKEEDRNREPAGSSKGGQFAKKGGGVYSDREIDPKDLDKDSDFRKNEVISEEDYEKLEIGSEYVEYSRDSAGYLRPTDEGYNLGKTLTIKVKNEYSDDPDQYVKELKYYYDDDGKHVTTMTVEKTDSERDAEYVSSEKRLNEDGEFEEIEYTDEEHYKNLKRFVQSYSKRGDEHKIWDKLQEKTLKVQSKNSRFSDFQNKRLELQKEIDELNISALDDKELLKEKDLKELELYKLEYGKEYDDISKLKFNDYYGVKQQLSVAYKNDRRELSFKNSGINADKDKTTIPFEDMKDYVKELDPKEKLIFEKFNRIKDNLNSDIEKGKIKGIGLDKMNDNFILSYENNVVMNNIGSERGEKNMDKIDTSRKMYEMLDQINEKYYEDSSSNMTIGSSYFNVIDHIKNKNEVDNEKMKKFDEELKAIQETEKDGSNSKEWTEKFMEKMDYKKSVEDSMTDRDQKILEMDEEMKKYDNYSKDYFNSIKDDTQFIKLRNKNEYLTPLIEKNIHLYSFPDKNSSIPEETIRHAYDKIKETYTKNNWVSTDLKNRVKSPDHTGLVRIPNNRERGEYERKMNYQLHEKEGRPFTSGGKTFKQGGNWDKTNESINVFKATERAIDWVHDHELAHSFYDYTVDAIDNGQLKNKKVSLDKWKSTVLTLDPKIIEPILGNYPTTYLNDYLKDPTSKNNQFMLAHEMFTGITDLKTGKMKGKYDEIEEAYEELNRHYPELVKAYETLKGVEDYNIYGESLTKDTVKEDIVKESIQNNEFAYQQTSYLNDDHNVVTKENATTVIVKSYTKDGRLILSESYFVEKQATEDNPNREPAGTSKGGQFAKKDGGGSISDIKKDLQKNIEPTEKETEIQTKIDVDVRERIQEKIDELGLTDKVDYVETQGSYVKGTDLPSKGSDMDIFVVFNPNVSEEERKDLGLKIGLATLDKEYANSQGWDNFKVDAKDQENKYAEAFFDVDGQTVEVQIVPTRNMDRYDIIKKEINGQKETANGNKISIGMERTPHQTKFMNENLSVEQKLEVRTLKKFMKETGLYDSSVKSQGFSGYSTEVLIHNLGSFENVVDYFADYKMGEVIGLPSESDRKDLAEHGVELTYMNKNKEIENKYTKEYYNTDEAYKNNSIHMTDPIDPNRDIGGAISEAKLAKTILTMKHLKETGKTPDKVEPTTMNGVSLTFTSSGTDENTIGSQVQSLQNDMVAKLDNLGFKVEKEFDKPKEIVDGFSINPDRINIEQEKGSKEMTINFGMDNIYTDGDEEKTIDISGMREQQITGMIMGLDKSGTKYEKKDGKITTYKPRQFKNVKDAMKALLEGTVKGTALSNNNVLRDIRSQNVDPFTKFTKFDNLPK